MLEDREAEARITALEGRVSFCEQRLAAIERFVGSAIKLGRPRKRELTPEQRKAVRARLMAGQERARARREAEMREQALSEARGTGKAKK